MPSAPALPEAVEAKRLAALLRARHDAAGRVQGFYSVTFDITELHEAQRQLELLAAVTTSVGVATCVEGQASASDLLARADGALYEAKRQGRDRYAVA